MELFLFLMDEVAMFLARYASFDKSMAIGLHGRPKVTGVKDSSSHGACARMIAAYAFM